MPDSPDQNDISMEVPGSALDQAFEAKSFAEWRELAERSLGDDRTLSNIARESLDGNIISPLYHERPMPVQHYKSDPLQHWDNRLCVNGNSIDECRADALRGLEGGITSLELHVNDSAGDNKIPVDSLQGALVGVHLDMAAISLRAGNSTVAAADALGRCWQARGIAADKVAAAFNIDPMGTLAASGQLNKPFDSALQELATLARESARMHPQVTAVCVNSTYYHNAGASPIQELVAAIATAALYLDAMLDAGMPPATACNTLVFQTACDADYLMSLTKLRALQKLWRHLVQQTGIDDISTAIVAETSTRYLSRREPWVNHLRNVGATTAAAVGGAQTIVVHSHNRIAGHWLDEDRATGERMARNLPLVLQHECAITAVRDPMAGAYAADTLTDDICQNVWSELRQLQAAGGLLRSLQNGHLQQSIADTQSLRIARLHAETDIRVGVNRFADGPVCGEDMSSSATASRVREESTSGTTRPAASVSAAVAGTQHDGERITPLTPQRDSASFELAS